MIFDFKRKGFKTLAAGNGVEALALLESNAVDLVISDIQMPGGNGVELLKQVRVRNAAIPVLLFITGFSDLTLEEAYALGADATLCKPFSRKELMDRVMRAIE